MAVALVFYTISVFALLGVILSYGLAVKITKSLSVLSLLVFFIAVFILLLVVVSDLFKMLYDMPKMVTVGIHFRSLFLAVASIFLLYTTWRKD